MVSYKVYRVLTQLSSTCTMSVDVFCKFDFFPPNVASLSGRQVGMEVTEWDVQTKIRILVTVVSHHAQQQLYKHMHIHGNGCKHVAYSLNTINYLYVP